ncbi:MAG: hypothetical protein JO327_06440 [Nitrososphaeraceae archaeon]|nr:hypothetical protein [Nitrososphaeraceae archaeon]
MKSISFPQLSNLTLTVIPSYTAKENVHNSVNPWITPNPQCIDFLNKRGCNNSATDLPKEAKKADGRLL